MIRMKVKEQWQPPPEAPIENLPVPMPATLDDARRELTVCEERGDWTRAAALKYAAIPWLEQEAARQHEIPTHAEPFEPAYQPPGMTGHDWRLIGGAVAGTVGLGLWVWLGAAVGALAPSNCFIAGFFAVPVLLAMGWPGWLVILGAVLKSLH